MQIRKKIMMLMLLFSLLQLTISAQTLNVHIQNIHNKKGQICVAVFADEVGFKAEKTVWELKYPKCSVDNGGLYVKIQIQAGKYGLSVLDDENENGKMDYGLFGIPTEGFGFSNYYHKGIFKPCFDDFSFVIEKNEEKPITVIMKYF